MSTLGCTGIRSFFEAKGALPPCPDSRGQRRNIKDRVLVLFGRLGSLCIWVDYIEHRRHEAVINEHLVCIVHHTLSCRFVRLRPIPNVGDKTVEQPDHDENAQEGI